MGLPSFWVYLLKKFSDREDGASIVSHIKSLKMTQNVTGKMDIGAMTYSNNEILNRRTAVTYTKIDASEKQAEKDGGHGNL